jgi:hypothetical protein
MDFFGKGREWFSCHLASLSVTTNSSYFYIWTVATQLQAVGFCAVYVDKDIVCEGVGWDTQESGYGLDCRGSHLGNGIVIFPFTKSRLPVGYPMSAWRITRAKRPEREVDNWHTPCVEVVWLHTSCNAVYVWYRQSACLLCLCRLKKSCVALDYTSIRHVQDVSKKQRPQSAWFQSLRVFQ